MRHLKEIDRTAIFRLFLWTGHFPGSLRTQWVNSFMQSLLQRVSFYLHCSLDINKDKMIPSAAVTA